MSEVPDRFYERLVGAGLIEPRVVNSSSNLSEFLERYVDMKTVSGSYKGEWTKPTAIKRKQTVNDLLAYFGANKDIRDVSAEESQRWKNWLLGEQSRNLSPASTSKKLKDARQFFEFAIEMELIERNPFAKLKLPPQDNAERMQYIPKVDIETVLSVITDPEFRLVIALARYAGFRTPSEGQRLRWRDVRWSDQTMLVCSPKLARYGMGGRRECPIFPELIPFFESLPDPGDQSEAVMPAVASLPNANLRTQFSRYIAKVGLTPWPKLFHNLRASALTDLVDKHSLPSVCKWLGTSPKIAMKHLLHAAWSRAVRP